MGVTAVSGDQILKSLGAAGQCIRLLAGLGACLIVAGVLGLLMIRLSRLIWPDGTEKKKGTTSSVSADALPPSPKGEG